MSTDAGTKNFRFKTLFIGPTAVIGKFFGAEEVRFFRSRRGVVDEGEYNLAYVSAEVTKARPAKMRQSATSERRKLENGTRRDKRARGEKERRERGGDAGG